MADKAIASLSASVFLDELRSSMSGKYNYEPAVTIASSSGEGWIFTEQAVDHNASTDLLGTGDNYLGGTVGAAATGDKIMWIAIKNTSSTSTEGVGICFDAGTAAYDDEDTLIIGPGELWMGKVPNSTIAKLHARTCTLDGTYGYPTAQGTASITCLVAAIIKNVG